MPLFGRPKLALPSLRADRALWLGVALLVLVGGAVRFATAQDDLWFDEVWSWWIARGLLPTWLIDNNHPLNTLWIAAMPDTAPSWMFRLLSIVSGCATICFGALAARHWGRLHALATAFVMAAAYPLVLYQSEARGYAPMLAAMLATLWLSLRYAKSPTPRGPIWVLLAVLVGIASHLGFVVGYAAIVAVSTIFGSTTTGERFRYFVRLHLAPLALCAIAYVGFYARMEIGGGPVVSVSNALAATGGEFVGLPASLGFGAIGLMALVATFAWRRGRSDVVAWLTLAVLSAAAIAWKQAGDCLYVRYFLPSMMMAWLAGGWAVGELARRKPALAMASLLAWMSLQLAPVLDLAYVGRARHGDALAWMAERSAEREITVGTDQPTRTGVLVEFYRRRMKVDAEITMVQEGQPLAPADFLILGPRRNYPDVYRAADGTEFTRSAIFPTASKGPHDSGWDWQVYRRVEAPTPVMVLTPED